MDRKSDRSGDRHGVTNHLRSEARELQPRRAIVSPQEFATPRISRAVRKATTVFAVSVALLTLSAAVSLKGSELPLGTAPAAATEAPSCIHYNLQPGALNLITIYNRCSYGYSGSYMYVRVVISLYPDSPCKKLIRNHRWDYVFGGGAFDHLALCKP